ncbi:kinase-like domain-containing protein [Rhizophagus irregularis DAOM 181602=DAOM 197198]|uniref:Kinase-like domain-containing protein n=1 Tax=Rhizophagus irregularis (strain DAOM 181602 / DAOM 197198 / MUCL 43194) TaxID=747089 RepID=A0A2P4PC94_RHIID|nr:kinase-like domain-containing protein [Rhizophagus irregularis DAOM 181602=DAOM 197198]POG63028.1 kinase-like domain-containing protein [Rhizophagus irregularis DAOM 181602=DAOM 197198]|eukprot:XP_025169894.1 kinase-like domain-containing protein [Rhizophagus irregularis DAOM 181602=DAOM 197198]
MLVMNEMSVDLRKYLQQNHKQLTWKDRMIIINEIICALYFIHKEKAIHRDLHSGNILYSQLNNSWRVSDLGFCGPADKPSESIYGNLPYIAPEVIVGREYTFASDIYSIAILMWEISSGQPPFVNYEHENDIVMNIINGIRPKIVPGTPLEYKNLMKECWDADPLKRPDAYTLCKKIEKINLYYQNMSDELFKSEMDNLEMNKVEENYTSSRLFTSKIHNFGNLHEPRNATEGTSVYILLMNIFILKYIINVIFFYYNRRTRRFHSKSYDFNIPNNINDFNKSNEQNSSKSSKVITIFRDSNKKLSKLFKKLQIKSNNDKKEKTQKYVDDDDDLYNNPNLHSNEQDELEIPDVLNNHLTMFFLYFKLLSFIYLFIYLSWII